MIVDGMNVIGTRPDGWWKDRDGAVRRLLARLCDYADVTGADVTLVLDGRPLDDLPEGSHDGIRVAYARRRGRDAADDRIVQLVGSDPEPATLVVVTSDRELAGRVTGLGASTEGAGSFLRRLERILDQ